MDRREVYKSHPVAVLRQEVMKHLNKEVLVSWVNISFLSFSHIQI